MRFLGKRKDHRKFAQRYYEYTDHFRLPDGPIFLKVCGESACDGIANDYITVLAKKFGAAVVTLEHRYYGKSSPFKSLTTENLKYLSSNQETLTVKLKRLGVENPWFVFGISYSGALSAWFCLKFSHLTCGSLASSGVVLAIYNFTKFDQQIGESAGPECKAVLQEITTLIDQRLASDGKSLKTLFDANELKIDGDFLYFLADAAVIAFQYGNPDRLCSPLIEAKNAGADLVNAYAKYVKEYYVGSFGASPQTYNQQHLKKTALSGDSGDRLWWFQVCTEVAYFQVAPANDSIRSSKVDTRKEKAEYCVFWIEGSKIVFTNGSQDPRRHASKQTSSPDMPSYIITCHYCGHGTDLRGCPQSPLSPEGNAQNCSSPDAVNKVRQQVIEQIDLWQSQCQSGGRSSM